MELAKVLKSWHTSVGGGGGAGGGRGAGGGGGMLVGTYVDPPPQTQHIISAEKSASS